MKTLKHLGLLFAGSLAITACSAAPALQATNAAASAAAGEYTVQHANGDCCAVVGSSQINLGGTFYTFEFNTAANSTTGLGRVVVTSPSWMGNEVVTIEESLCLFEDETGNWIGTQVYLTGGAIVDLTGEVQGSHVQVDTVNFISPLTLRGVTFTGSFDTRPGQNVFPDPDCNGIPMTQGGPN